MLRHTFCHLPGVGETTERRLWARGLTTWDAALAAAGHRLSADNLRASADHYGRGNPAWFAALLPWPQLWRLFADFRDRCAYLDIETTGMGPTAHVTAIALYDGRAVRTYVHGRNLDDFAADVADYRLLVTYNGKPPYAGPATRKACRRPAARPWPPSTSSCRSPSGSGASRTAA